MGRDSRSASARSIWPGTIPLPTRSASIWHPAYQPDGRCQHDVYAPTTPDVLTGKRYDYWALGHIHAYRVVSESPGSSTPAVRRLGISASMGAKGSSSSRSRAKTVDWSSGNSMCCGGSRTTVELTRPTNAARCSKAVQTQLEACRDRAEGRLAAVRLQLSGRCEFHREIEKPQGRSEVIGELRNLANQIDDLWLEKIELETAPPVDVEALRSGSDLFGELLRDFDQWRNCR